MGYPCPHIILYKMHEITRCNPGLILIYIYRVWIYKLNCWRLKICSSLQISFYIMLNNDVLQNKLKLNISCLKISTGFIFTHSVKNIIWIRRDLVMSSVQFQGNCNFFITGNLGHNHFLMHTAPRKKTTTNKNNQPSLQR